MGRQGLLVRDCESSYLALDPAKGEAIDDLLGHSITYRIAIGPSGGESVHVAKPAGRTAVFDSRH